MKVGHVCKLAGVVRYTTEDFFPSRPKATTTTTTETRRKKNKKERIKIIRRKE